ncbi:comEA protein [Catenulispora sp. GP43]|uniref:ComEA family DNA-binding protein n=1 Tax=Catenulispora sp. GP43 TaxID=3156263 RepID=UPI0035128C88
MERTTPGAAPNGSVQPRSPQPTARDRLASLQGDPPRYWSPAAEGPLPLSEALAARRHAHRSWWRRAAQSIEHRVPPTLRGRWALSLPAATAVALVAVAGAAAGGWYLTRSQSTVVDVAAGNAGEAVSAAAPPEDDHATPTSDVSGSGFAASGHDAACHPYSSPSGAPRALPTASPAEASPTSWHAHRAIAVPVAARSTVTTTWFQAPITHRYAQAMAAKRPACSPRSARSTTPALAGPASTGAVVVDVEGKVARPGIQTLPPGSRVYEALAAAGGALPGVDVTALDLARPVTDGEQLRVGIAGAPTPVVGLPQPSSGGAARGKRGKPAQPVDLNTATLEQLETVPDIGPALAQRILDFRTEHGRFESVAQLRQVRGIGERKFADMRDSVTVTVTP